MEKIHQVVPVEAAHVQQFLMHHIYQEHLARTTQKLLLIHMVVQCSYITRVKNITIILETTIIVKSMNILVQALHVLTVITLIVTTGEVLYMDTLRSWIFQLQSIL